MRIITSFKEDFVSDKPLSAALGFFDGFHIGHMEILNAAKQEGCARAVVTFSNSPKEFITGEETESLMSREEKIAFLDEEGIEYLIMLAFDDELMNISKEDFFKRILLHFNCKKIAAGFNFTFGRNKEGDSAALVSLGEKYGVQTVIVPKVTYLGETVSSSRIKSAIKAHDIKKAEAMLGRTLKGENK